MKRSTGLVDQHLRHMLCSCALLAKTLKNIKKHKQNTSDSDVSYFLDFSNHKSTSWKGAHDLVYNHIHENAVSVYRDIYYCSCGSGGCEGVNVRDAHGAGRRRSWDNSVADNITSRRGGRCRAYRSAMRFWWRRRCDAASCPWSGRE